MEENENVEVNETETVSENNSFLKDKKNIIIVAVVAIIAVLVIFNVFFNTKGKAKAVVKKYVKAMNSLNAKKMIKCIEPYGTTVFADLDSDEYEDFWKEYKEFLKSDDYKDAKEEYKDNYKDNIEELQKDFNDLKEERKEDDIKYSIKVKKFTDIEKIGKNLYKVEAKVITKEDGDEEKNKMIFYVMKKGLKCYLVSGLGYGF